MKISVVEVIEGAVRHFANFLEDKVTYRESEIETMSFKDFPFTKKTELISNWSI